MKLKSFWFLLFFAIGNLADIIQIENRIQNESFSPERELKCELK